MTTELEEPIDISQTKQSLQVVDFPLDYDRKVSTWKKYGYEEVPLLARTDDGTLYDDHALKAICKYRGNKLEFRRFVNRKYVLLPNEEVDIIVRKTINEVGDKFGLKLYKTHTAYNGDAKYWEIRSDRKFTIESSVTPRDVVQLGIIVRNSIGRGVAFGGDVFTFRLVCQNGAISKGKDLLSLKIPHYGKDSLKAMYEGLSRRIEDLFREGDEIIKMYERAAKLKVRQETAEILVKKVSQRYLPEYIDIDPDTHKVTLTDKRWTFWELFNSVTKEVWHSTGLNFLTKSDITNVMHSVMRNEIAVAAK